MPSCPHLSHDQINKILNCQDSFMGKMQELDQVVKKLNTAALKLEADFLQPPEIAANYENKKRNLEAAEKADAEVQILIDEYEKIVIAINDNIDYYNTLLNYQTNMDDLMKYYYKTINKDKEQIEAIESKKAIAQRMTTYYRKKTESVSWYNYYLKYLYWIVVIIVGGLFIFLFFGKLKNYALASIAIKCDNMIKDYKKNNKDLNSNWLIRMCEKSKFNLERHFVTNKLGGGKEEKSDKKADNGIVCGIKSTGLIFFLLIFTPYILMPTMRFIKPYLFPYA